MLDVLIVEDGRSERERLEKLLRDAGYCVEACESVSEAERSLRASSFRLAIIDIGLGDKSGSYLFDLIKRGKHVSYVMILTGNPSAHLEQRFIEEGAIDYIVKGSIRAQSEALLIRIREIIGEPAPRSVEDIPLDEFLKRFVPETSRRLFLDMGDSFPACSRCGANDYVVTFARRTQMPPEVSGVVACASCSAPMDPDVT